MRTHRKDPAPGARAKRIFSYLDDEMSDGERAAFEGRLGTDPLLAAEVESHRVLLAALDEMAVFSPSPDFRMRVLASLAVRESWWVRIGHRVRSAASPAPNLFTALLDEGLAPRQARALMAFVERDRAAAATLENWRRLFRALESLPALDPSEGFADRVMARVGTLERQRSSRPAVVRVGAGIALPPFAARHLARAREWTGRRWPTPHERFAVTSGMAVGPVAAFLVTLHMLSGNPLLTASNVASFVQARTGATLARLSDAVFAGPPANSAMGRIAGILDGWVPSGPATSAGLAVFGVLTLASAWVLYRNVIKVSRSEIHNVPA